MSYPTYKSTLNRTNQFQFGLPAPIQFQPQPFWRGIDYFKAHAPNIDPTIFKQVYSSISGAGTGITSVGVGIDDARVWHRRAYGGFSAIKLTPQETGYASAYEAYRVWIHNTVLHAPRGVGLERQREAFIGLAVAEASKMYMISRPADAYGRIPLCEAAAATAWLIFDQNLTDSVRRGMRAKMGHDTGIGGAHGSRFGTPGMAGISAAGATDPYAIDYEAPYFRKRKGRDMRSSTTGATNGTVGAHSLASGTGRSGMGSSVGRDVGSTSGRDVGSSVGSPRHNAYSDTTTVIQSPRSHHSSSSRIIIIDTTTGKRSADVFTGGFNGDPNMKYDHQGYRGIYRY